MLLKEYFPNKSFLPVYINLLGDRFAQSLSNVFIGVFFFSVGMPLHIIFLFYALELLFRGIFSSFSVQFVSKYGIKNTILISYINLIIFFILVALSNYSLVIGFCSFIFKSFGRGLYYPLLHAFHSVCIQDKMRGKQFSLEQVLNSIIVLIAIAFGSFVLEYTSSYLLISVVASITLIFSWLPYFFSKNSIKNIKLPKNVKYIDSFKFLFSKEFKKNWLPFTGQGIVIVTNHMLIGLFIYFVVGDFKLFGFILGLVVLVEFVLTLLFGNFVDKNHNESLKNSAKLHAISNVNMGLFAKTVFLTTVLQLFNQITWSLFDNSFTTKIHRKIQNSKTDSFLYASTKEMGLCFSEVLVFLFYMILVLILSPKYFFTFVFFFTVLGIYLAVKYFKD